MQSNRISRYQWQESTAPSVAVAAPESFIVCPGCMTSATSGWSWQQEVFRIAYEVARAKQAALARAAAFDQHRLFSNWN